MVAWSHRRCLIDSRSVKQVSTEAAQREVNAIGFVQAVRLDALPEEAFCTLMVSRLPCLESVRYVVEWLDLVPGVIGFDRETYRQV